MTLLRLQPSGRYREVRSKKGALYSEILTGFCLRPEWCWQDPPPDELELLEEMLGEGVGRR